MFVNWLTTNTFTVMNCRRKLSEYLVSNIFLRLQLNNEHTVLLSIDVLFTHSFQLNNTILDRDVVPKVLQLALFQWRTWIVFFYENFDILKM